MGATTVYKYTISKSNIYINDKADVWIYPGPWISGVFERHILFNSFYVSQLKLEYLGAQSNDKYLCLRFDEIQYLRFITASFIWIYLICNASNNPYVSK